MIIKGKNEVFLRIPSAMKKKNSYLDVNTIILNDFTQKKMVFKASCAQGSCITPINSVEGVLK